MSRPVLGDTGVRRLCGPTWVEVQQEEQVAAVDHQPSPPELNVPVDPLVIHYESGQALNTHPGSDSAEEPAAAPLYTKYEVCFLKFHFPDLIAHVQKHEWSVIKVSTDSVKVLSAVMECNWVHLFKYWRKYFVPAVTGYFLSHIKHEISL